MGCTSWARPKHIIVSLTQTRHVLYCSKAGPDPTRLTAGPYRAVPRRTGPAAWPSLPSSTCVCVGWVVAGSTHQPVGSPLPSLLLLLKSWAVTLGREAPGPPRRSQSAADRSPPLRLQYSIHSPSLRFPQTLYYRGGGGSEPHLPPPPWRSATSDPARNPSSSCPAPSAPRPTLPSLLPRHRPTTPRPLPILHPLRPRTPARPPTWRRRSSRTSASA